MSERQGPKWPLFVLIALMLAAAGIGGLMTWHHETQLYGDASGELIGCEASEEVDCDIVNTSEHSEFMGVPIATWGIGTYLAIGLLAVGGLRGRRQDVGLILVVGGGTVLYSAFLFWVSKTQLNYVCAWCMRLYAINLAIPVLALLAKPAAPDGSSLGRFAGAFVALTLLGVGGQRAFRATLLGDAPEIAALDEVEEAAPAGPSDPEGPAPALSFEVQTEDKKAATLRIEPDDAWKGNPDAQVAVVEFADLECGYCKRAAGQLRRLYGAYGDRVLFVFKHFPMDPSCNAGVKNKKHRYACVAAQASVCAQQQGYFWAYHDLAFKNQHQLKRENLEVYAETVGVDMDAWRSCMRDPASAQAVAADGAHGKELDVHGTPRIFIDGRLYRSGNSAEQMARAIEAALGNKGPAAAQAAAEMADERLVVQAIPADVETTRAIEFDGLSFQIDTFEAGLTDGAAVAGLHEIPATRMSWFAARDACEAAGKRMCTEEEWIAACQGQAPVDDDGDGQHADDMIEGNAYPYGDYHARGRCWEDKDRDTFRPVYTGEMPACVTEQGVYDLTGNVEEWVGATPETAILLGGAYDTKKDHARCYRRNDTYGPGYANKRTGFRCCGD